MTTILFIGAAILIFAQIALVGFHVGVLVREFLGGFYTGKAHIYAGVGTFLFLFFFLYLPTIMLTTF